MDICHDKCKRGAQWPRSERTAHRLCVQTGPQTENDIGAGDVSCSATVRGIISRWINAEEAITMRCAASGLRFGRTNDHADEPEV